MITKGLLRGNRVLSSPVLKALFGSQARARLLTQFLLHPDEAFHVRELERRVKEPAGNLLRDLRRFRAIDLVETEKIGNQVRYRMDKSHPIYRDLQRLILKTVAADMVLKDALRSVHGIDLAFLYGSFVKGEATTRSDVDVMFIGSVQDRDLAPAIARAERILGREISYTRYTREEARRRSIQRGSFFQQVLMGPRVVFVGSEQDALFAFARR